MLVCALLLALAGAPALDDTTDDSGTPIKDDKKLQGTWKVESLVTRGRPARTVQLMTWAVKGNEWTLIQRNRPGSAFTAKMDPSKKVKTIDLTRKTAQGETVLKGIYKLEGDTLTLCYSPITVGKRPAEFKSTAENREILFVMKRVKEKDGK